METKDDDLPFKWRFRRVIARMTLKEDEVIDLLKLRFGERLPEWMRDGDVYETTETYVKHKERGTVYYTIKKENCLFVIENVSEFYCGIDSKLGESLLMNENYEIQREICK